MDTVTLNIGLTIGEPSSHRFVRLVDIRYALHSHGVHIKTLSIYHGIPEKTAVLTISRKLTDQEAYNVCDYLEQEAIAQRVNGVGELLGPQADKWRPFNPEFFYDHEEQTPC